MDGIIIAIIAAVSSLISTVLTFLLQRIKNSNDKQDAMAQGMRALLWREICTIHKECVSKGGITLDEREHLENVYQAYHAIGGNGTGTRLYEEAMQQSTIC